MCTQRSAEQKDRIRRGIKSGRLPPVDPAEFGSKGSFVTRNGKLFAGTHLIIDLQHATNLNDLYCIREALIEAIRVSSATLLHIHLHVFSGGGGVSGVAVLAELHISIHTWPECGYAALDVFMCGKCDPYLTLPVLRRAFAPKEVKVQEFLRGEVPRKWARDDGKFAPGRTASPRQLKRGGRKIGDRCEAMISRAKPI